MYKLIDPALWTWIYLNVKLNCNNTLSISIYPKSQTGFYIHVSSFLFLKHNNQTLQTIKMISKILKQCIGPVSLLSCSCYLATREKEHIVVVGGGIIGSWSTWYLIKLSKLGTHCSSIKNFFTYIGCEIFSYSKPF